MLKRIILIVTVISLSFCSHSAIAGSHADSLKNLDMNEIMFAQGMIPHHQQAIDMSSMALKNGASAKVKKLAKEIISSQRKEISQLKYWLTATQSPLTMDHDMGMNGMLSKTELAALKKLKGSKFNAAFLKAMIAHHEGALEMIALLDGTEIEEAREFAENILIGQRAEITLMKKLLAKLK